MSEERQYRDTNKTEKNKSVTNCCRTESRVRTQAKVLLGETLKSHSVPLRLLVQMGTSEMIVNLTNVFYATDK